MTRLVGILNATPDSFSDGGRYASLDAQLAHIAQMRAQGADVIDIGAESTRPGAAPLSADEEWQRLAPLMAQLPSGMIFSLDTRHAQNAARALEHGVTWINDVSGFTSQTMIDAVKHSDCTLVMMHSLSVPADKNLTLPEGCDVIAELITWLDAQMTRLAQAGIARERILFDPGLGFGKTASQSWQVIDRIDELQALGVPLYVGHSRKSFLSCHPERSRGILDTSTPLCSAQDDMTLEVSRHLINAGVAYLRVHNVAIHQALL